MNYIKKIEDILKKIDDEEVLKHIFKIICDIYVLCKSGRFKKQ